MSFLTDAIAARKAELSAEFVTPTGDPGFGSDLSCTDDLTASMDEIPGDSSLAVAQANYRRITTPLGALVDEEDYGIEVRSYVGKAMTPAQVSEIQGEIRGELLKDDRNESIDEITVLASADASEFSLDIRGTTAAGPFSLTVAVTDAGALLKEIQG